MWALKVFAFFTLTIVIHAQDEITVDTALGSVKGLKATTNFNGKPYFSFKGVPYAKPPVGPNKFDAPSPPEPWSGVLDATAHRHTCIFFCMIRQGIFGNEDCLYLNVYTPSIEKNANKPVIVYIVPGGFNAGSGDDDVYGPDFLVEQDVILVTFNSRLGAHGFLSTGDENAPGNNGLKDQVMVLKWVKEHIANFGGNPDKVTLFGTSSGSASTQFHMLSPMSKGLFKGAIMESGSVLNPWAMSYNPKDMAFKLGEVLGIKTSSTKELVDKLKEFTVQEIVSATGQVDKTLNPMNGRASAFLPTVEPNAGQEIFMPNDPWTLIKNGDIFDVPVMIGMTRDETAFMAELMIPGAPMMNEHFDLFIPDELNATDAQKKEWGDMLRKFYFDGKDLTIKSRDELIKMTSDEMFNAGVLMSSKIFSNRIKSPVYKYLFSYYSTFGIMKNLFKLENGVAHTDEIGYLFYSNAFKNKFDAGSVQEKMVRVLTKLWANFAKEGNPTPSLDDDLTVTWNPMGPEDNFLEISQDMKMDKNLLQERLKFWAQIYKDALGDYASLFK